MSLVFSFPDIFVFTIGMLPFLPLLVFLQVLLLF